MSRLTRRRPHLVATIPLPAILGRTQFRGEKAVVVREAEFRGLVGRRVGPPFPDGDDDPDWWPKMLVYLRWCSGVTKTELARICGLPRETISRIENGRQAPQGATEEKLYAGIQQIKEQLGCASAESELFGEE